MNITDNDLHIMLLVAIPMAYCIGYFMGYWGRAAADGERKEKP